MRVRIHISAWMYILLPLAIFFGGISLVAIYCAAVFFHEMCHALAAKALGFSVDKMEIMPFGAYADIVGVDEADSSSEFFIAIAGPCGSIFLLILALAAGRFIKSPEVELFAQVNMIMTGFNLMPGLPLDGGRCLRAVLRKFMDRGRATFIAAALGFVLGAMFLGLGIYYYATYGNIRPTAFSSGVFLLVSSVTTARNKVFSLYGAVKRREHQLSERRVLDVRHIAVHPTASLTGVVNRFSPNKYHIVTVIGDNVRRTMTEEQLLNAVMSGKSGQIGDVCKIFS